MFTIFFFDVSDKHYYWISHPWKKTPAEWFRFRFATVGIIKKQVALHFCLLHFHKDHLWQASCAMSFIKTHTIVLILTINHLGTACRAMLLHSAHHCLWINIFFSIIYYSCHIKDLSIFVFVVTVKGAHRSTSQCKNILLERTLNSAFDGNTFIINVFSAWVPENTLLNCHRRYTPTRSASASLKEIFSRELYKTLQPLHFDQLPDQRLLLLFYKF